MTQPKNSVELRERHAAPFINTSAWTGTAEAARVKSNLVSIACCRVLCAVTTLMPEQDEKNTCIKIKQSHSCNLGYGDNIQLFSEASFIESGLVSSVEEINSGKNN